MESNDIDTPAPLPTLDAEGAHIEEGAYVLTTGCEATDDPGEVWSHGRGKVLVSWPIVTRTGVTYAQDWHSARDLRVTG